MADTRDGVFDVGTFDNAKFDSVYATSNAGVFSTVKSKVSLFADSFANVFSGTDRVFAFNRFNDSYLSVYSTLQNLNLYKFVGVSSFANVYSSNNDTKSLSRAATSFANVFSGNSRVATISRGVSSFGNVYSSSKIKVRLFGSSFASVFNKADLDIFLKPSSFANAYSTNKSVTKLFASSSATVFSTASRTFDLIRDASASFASVYSSNSLVAMFYASSSVGKVTSAMRALTDAYPVSGQLRTYLDMSRIWLRDDD